MLSQVSGRAGDGLNGMQLLSLARALGSRQGLADPQQSTGSLQADSCGTPTFCMAVGYYFYNGSDLPMSAVWNGSKWSRVPVPLPSLMQPASETELDSVSCVGSTFCMAVGNNPDSGPVVLTWNGKTWAYLTFPSVNSSPALYSVACPSASQCLAVGTYEASSGQQGLVENWNSTQGWEMLTTATLSQGQSDFIGVSCPSTAECMVVGSFTPQDRDDAVPLAELDVLGGWAIQPMPGGPAGYGTLAASTSCNAFDSCVAVGVAYDFSDDSFRAESYSWKGLNGKASTPWKTLATPQPGTATDELLSVSCQTASTVDCEAVGLEADQPHRLQLSTAMSLQGTKWSLRPSPSPAAFSALSGVSCISSTACAAVGSAATVQASEATGDVLEPGSATVQAIAVPTGLETTPSGVSCVSASACMMVGYDQNGTSTLTMAQFWNGHKWTTLRLPSPGNDASLAGVDCTSAKSCVAVGEATFGPGDVVENANTRSRATARNGQFGIVETWNGARWTLTNVLGDLPDELLQGVSCPSPSSCVAVGSGDGGVAISYSESRTGWRLQAMKDVSGFDSPASVACVSPSDCEAVGNGLGADLPFAQHWNGKAWTLQRVPQTNAAVENLSGVACPAANDCEAVGSTWTTDEAHLDNLIFRWNGKTWARQT
ncbi:MAG TPA: hypothetical protein VGP46_06890, partial [Acidimicrobiales bacterium]|nr:hypothetical protein [Acidimicrobiales bacterium]